ncbi:hypothetical protein [Microbacterium aurantiacum]|uniref:hypothetical protein n=1 Tax=Microbacterium aurantiacum TaxID=162393 RepID=UPI000C80EB8C|nr:hypothetical protein [Microbacterium aurantiacum]
MNGSYRGRRLFIRSTLNSVPGKLPWPMTVGEMVRYYVILVAVGLAVIVGGGWIGVLLFEPSPWRLLPIALLFVLVRFVIARPLMRALRPHDVTERWTAFEAQGDPVDQRARRWRQR